MKNKILKIYVLILFAFIFSINEVSAIVCTYGTKSDNNAEWQKKFSFIVDDYNKIYLDISNSPELSSVDEENSVENKKKYMYYEYVDTDGQNDKYKIYVSMFSNETMYEDIKKTCVERNRRINRDDKDYSDVCGCPPALRYYYMKESFTGWSTFHWLIYNDEMDKPDVSEDGFKFNDNDGIRDNDFFIEEREKGKNLEEIEISPCPTYTYAMENIKNYLYYNGCDSNKDFDDAYTDLQERCEALRATSTYSDEDGTPKACQKACTNLYDEVEDNIDNICGPSEKIKYCGSLGNKIVNWIFKIIRMIRYALPAVVIILSILDYIKALASGDEGEVKKVNKRFMYRILAVALLFIVPFILDFIFKIFDIPGFNSSNPFCAK